MQSETKSTFETFKVEGGQLIDAVKRIIHEGNVRRIVIQQEGRTLVEFPLTLGVVGAALAPMLAAIGTIAALVTDCTITVERDEPTKAGSTNGTAGGSSQPVLPESPSNN